MKLYKLTIKQLSSICTPLKGDTIWGHFVWGIANHEGDEAVEFFLNQSKTDKPPLVISSAFPSGMICRPIPEPQEHIDSLSRDQYSQIKKEKKRKYISSNTYFTKMTEEISDFEFVNSTVMHNSINRLTNSVVDGGLYATDEIWYKNNFFDIYILSDSYGADRIKQMSEWAFENGYGANSSSGNGNIEVTGTPVEVECSYKSKKYMALAPFIQNDFSFIKKLRSDIFVRTGKIGGAFVSKLSPWKKTVVLYDEGAVFESEEPISFIGQLISDIHSDSRICQSGFAPVIPIE